MLTKDNKKKFDEWYITTDNSSIAVVGAVEQGRIGFDELTFEMQKGVLERYYNILGYILELEHQHRRINIWDYTDGEPEEAIVVDCEYEEYDELLDWWKVAYLKMDSLINDKN